MTHSRLSRAAAFLAGLVVFLGAVLMSLGLVLLAPVGTWVSHRVQRARGRSFGPLDGWLGAVSATIVAMVILSTFVAARLPPATWRQMRHAVDSASTASATKPPPRWLSRATPSNRYPIARPRLTPSLGTAGAVWGFTFGIGIMGALLGTVGWVGTTLMIFGASGRWPGASTPIVVDADTA